jgi:hypothetical protein
MSRRWLPARRLRAQIAHALVRMTRCAPNGAIAVRVPLGITIQEVIRLGVVPISYVHALGQQLTPERMTDWNNVWASLPFSGKTVTTLVIGPRNTILSRDSGLARRGSLIVSVSYKRVFKNAINFRGEISVKYRHIIAGVQPP